MPGDASAAVDSGSGPAPSSALTVPGGSQQRVRKIDVECDVKELVEAAFLDRDHPLWREYPDCTNVDQLYHAILKNEVQNIAEILSRHGFRRFGEALMSSDDKMRKSAYNASRRARKPSRQEEVQGTFNCVGAFVSVAEATTNAMTRANDQTSQASQATLQQAFDMNKQIISRFCQSNDQAIQANQTTTKHVLESNQQTVASIVQANYKNMEQVLGSFHRMAMDSRKHERSLIDRFDALTPSKSGGTETSGTVIHDQTEFASIVADKVVHSVAKVASADKLPPVELFSSPQSGGTGLGFETAGKHALSLFHRVADKSRRQRRSGTALTLSFSCSPFECVF